MPRPSHAPALILALLSPLAMAPLAASPVAAPSGSLCKPGEAVIFECNYGKQRAAVCGGGAGKSRYAQYRYGSAAKLELQYPRAGTAGAGNMTYATVGYSGGGEQQILFSNGGYDYYLYSRMIRTGFDGRGNNPDFQAGLVVRRGGHVIAHRPCPKAQGARVNSTLAAKYMREGEAAELP